MAEVSVPSIQAALNGTGPVAVRVTNKLTEDELEPLLAAVERLVKGEGSWTEVIEKAREVLRG